MPPEIPFKDWNFDFVVEKLQEKEAEELLSVIIAWVEHRASRLAGGFKPVEEAMEDRPVNPKFHQKYMEQRARIGKRDNEP